MRQWIRPMLSPMEHATDNGIPCRRCLTEKPAGQTGLFQAAPGEATLSATHDGAVLIENELGGWPQLITSRCGRAGFWRERTRALFGCRQGIGPLVVMPDTSVLIEVREYLDRLDEKTGIVVAPGGSPFGNRFDAMQDILQLWWSRDLRFAVSEEHLADGELDEARQLSREAAVRELGRDYWERGGLETFLNDQEAEVLDQPCAHHARPGPRPRGDTAVVEGWRWPKDAPDRRLAEAAYDAGCHVFLTSDKGILRSHASLFGQGMAVLSPGQLVDLLRQSGELEQSLDLDAPAPDLSTLSALHAGFPGA
jgi:hypothetical protein